jgi:lipopolysaccharide export system protein LptA
MNLRGKTGFMWKESMLYDEKAHRITMTGDVIVGREEVNPKGPERLYVAGDKIIADLVPPDPNAPQTQPATRPAMGLGGDLSKKMELKHVRVEGNVRVRSDKLNVEAATIDYDPASGTMTMRGSAGQPVRQFDADNVPQASFEEMIWNTKTSKIIASKLRGESTK